MKCRGGLWSPSRSQWAADDNNHTICLCLFYLQYLPLSYSCLHHSHFFWLSFIISDTTQAPIVSIWVFSFLSFISASIFSFSQFCLALFDFSLFVSIVICISLCPLVSPLSRLFSCLTLCLFSVTFLLRLHTTFWKTRFRFLAKT